MKGTIHAVEDQFVRVLKKPLTTVVVAAWVTQLSRWKMHPKRPTIGR